MGFACFSLRKKKVFLVMALVLVCLQSVSGASVPIRCWQFHTLDVPYVEKVLQKCPDYNINTVIFSHGMIWSVSNLYEDSNKGKTLRYLARIAKEQKLRVWVWIHELENDVPKAYFDGKTVQIDRPGFWDWLESKYEKLYNDFPEFDGILLTFHETKHKIFQNSEVQSDLSMPDRFAKLINTINTVCRTYEKDFVVRSFLYEPQELKWFAEGLQKVDSDVMLQSKCVPHDWQPFYPHNLMIGKFPERKLIVEFDCSSEFTGKNAIPYTCPEYFEYRWRYAMQQPGVIGYNARIDHGGYDALFTPNEINLYTLYRLTENPASSSKTIWKEWTVQHYGAPAAPFVQNALHPSFDIVNKAFFVLKFWITNHSALPEFHYANGHISERTIAKWRTQDLHYARLQKQLMHPSPELLESILMEKDDAIAQADEALLYLSQARIFLSEEDYADLSKRLQLLRRVGVVWKLHAEAFFGYKILVEGHQVPGLQQRIERAIKALHRQAKVSDLAGLNHKPPAASKQIRKIADELFIKLREWESQD